MSKPRSAGVKARRLGQHGLEGDGVGGCVGPARRRPAGGWCVRGHRRKDCLAGQGRHGEVAVRALGSDEREDDADACGVDHARRAVHADAQPAGLGDPLHQLSQELVPLNGRGGHGPPGRGSPYISA